MTLKHAKLLFEVYDHLVEENTNFPAEDMTLTKRPPRIPLSWRASLMHARWMCQQAQTFTDTEKAVRWLGFVQGILWCEGLRTIDAIREDNRK